MQGTDIHIGPDRQRSPFKHGAGLNGLIALSLAAMRSDGAHPSARGAMDRFRKAENPHRIDGLFTVRGLKRQDAVGGVGLNLARDLEYTYGEILREEYPIPSGLTLFPIDASVPVGARTYRQRRVYSEGEAVIHRAGVEVPRVGVSSKDEVRPIRHLATSWVTDLWDRQASGYAGTSLEGELMRVARDVVAEEWNHITWHGDNDNDIWGVFNYPWLDKVVSGVPLTAASTPDVILAELGRLANHAFLNSLSVFYADTVAIAPSLLSHLAITRIGSVNDTTILEFFKKANPRIKAVIECWELEGSGPGGTSGALFYRRDRHGISIVAPQQFTPLPAQAFGFEDITYAYMDLGGIRMPSVGNNVLIWF